MLDWLKRQWSRERLAEYTAIRNIPNRGLPPDLSEQEMSPAFMTQCKEIERSLHEPAQRPQADKPLFVELFLNDGARVLTLNRPDDGTPCLLVFSTPFRATDYANAQFNGGSAVTYLSSSPAELAIMLRDLRRRGIEQFALDCCPRCDVFTVFGSASVKTADDAINIWAISKAIELARRDLYLNYALVAARAGKLDRAREVLLESVAHVSYEDPRTHYLLGQIAVALRDRTLLREARAFLRHFQLESWERRLDAAIRSGSPDFALVA